MLKYFLILSLPFISWLTLSQTMIINSATLKTHKLIMSNTNLSLMTEAFNRLGITVEYRYRPDRRSIIEANNGMVDGEFARIATISDQYPNVVIVPEPFGHYEMVAFSLNPEIDLSSYRIGDNDYHIGYMHGWVNVTTLLQDYPIKTSIADHELLFKLLRLGRIDVVLFTKVGGEKILTNAQPKVNYSLSTPLLTYPTYLVLNKKHAAIAPRLAKEFKVLKEEFYSKRKALQLN